MKIIPLIRGNGFPNPGNLIINLKSLEDIKDTHSEKREKILKKTSFIRYWRTAQPDEMIDCPYQPGNLKILKKACLMRQQASQNFSLLREVHNEYFLFVVKQGLETCKNCPVG